MSSVPLKLKDSSAPVELQQMSTTEENYLAYQVGLGFASLDSSSVNQLGTNLSGSNRTVGTFTDTSFDSAVGTHSDLLTISQTDTLIRQKTGTASIVNTNYRVPVSMRDSGGQTIIDEMDGTKLNPLLDRIASRIYTSDYPGTYKLGTSAPSGDYSVNLADVMTDTRSDGHSLTYNIYKRNTMTAPTTVRPFAIKRSSGRTGTYQGLQVMTDDQIKYSLGIKIRNRISANANSIGSYKILSSATGTPTNAGFAGTWQAKGTATDTRQDAVLAEYTRSRSSTYTRTRNSTFSADYQRTRASTFLRSSTTSRSSTYSATYTKTRTSNYSPAFVGDYIGNYTTTTSDSFTRTSTRTDVFTRATQGNFVGNYTDSTEYTGNYTRNFTGNYLGTPYARSFSRTLYVGPDQERYWYSSYFSQDFTRNSTSDFTRNSVDGASYQRTSTVTFTGNYTRLASFVGNYTGETGQDFTRNSQRVTSTNFSRNFIGDYVGNFTRTRNSNYARNFEGNYSRNFTGNFTGDYSRTFVGNYLRNYSRTRVQTVFTRSFSTYQTGKGIWQYSSSSYVGSPQYYISNYSRQFLRYRDANYQRFRATNYARAYAGQYARNYQRSFVGNYTSEFDRTRSSNYVGAGTFTRDFLGNFVGNYARNFEAQYTGNYTTNYTGNYVGNYSRDFLGNYARTFAGNYTGTTIGASPVNIETYTLYVRVA